MISNKSRTSMSGRNVSASLFARLVAMVTSFVSRSVFVQYLGTEYLGLGGFFGNIFALVSLCELGMGAAVSQSLYKPLSTGNKYEISSIMTYYTRFCRKVALVTTLISLAALPVLPYVVKTRLDMPEIHGAYLLFVVHNCVSYLLLPKRCLVVCDQRMYVTTLAKSFFSVVGLLLQCFFLVRTGNYLLYLASRILTLTAEDATVNYYADKKYPCLTLKINVAEEYRRNLYKNVRALMWHKVGGVLSRSTDSLLLTYFVGLSGMGKYSNYALIIGTVGAFFDVAVNSVGASVGNLGAVDRGVKSEKVMRRLYFINFWLLTVGTSVIVSTLNPFIELWLGRDMLFTDAEMLVIVASFYFSCIRDPVQIFVITYGLFKESKYIPVLRAVANLVLSVFFVRKMGVAGVFLGTALSTVLVPLFGEVKVLYKYGFSMKPSKFYKEMLSYIGISFLCVSLSFLLTCTVKIMVMGLVLRGLSAFWASNALLFLFCAESEYFVGASSYVKRFLARKKKSKL